MTIGGLDPLPRDEKGIDLKKVFSTMRQAVLSKARWDVVEMTFLGLFSFSQFIMWSDIRNRAEDLKRSKIVRSLMSGKMEWKPEADFPDPEKLDEEYFPGDIAVPIAADASQLAAICAAGKGKSFILHGPPGTASPRPSRISSQTLCIRENPSFSSQKRWRRFPWCRSGWKKSGWGLFRWSFTPIRQKSGTS